MAKGSRIADDLSRHTGHASSLTHRFEIIRLPHRPGGESPLVAMGFFKILDVQLGVVLEGIQVLVPEQFLHMVNVGSAANELGRAGPPKGVRAHIFGESGSSDVMVEAAAEGVIGHSLAGAVQKESGLARIKDQTRPHTAHVALQRAQSRPTDRFGPTFAKTGTTQSSPAWRSG